MSERLRVGTRRSRLATVQTAGVLARLRAANPSTRFVPVPIDTSGDRDLRPGGSPDFTDAIDLALLRGRIELAVHSAKDLPVDLAPGLELLAFPRRADARDCLVVHRSVRPTALPRGARVGSSSPRRRAQLLRWRVDLEVVELRGNVDTRLEKVRRGEVEAAVLAVAGLQRLGWRAKIARRLSTERFLPAPAQGALAVVGRAEDPRVAGLVARVNDPTTEACVRAERAVARRLGADCRLPFGALARRRDGRLVLEAEVLSPEGQRSFRARARGSAAAPESVGDRAGEALLALGAGALIARRRR